MSEVYDYGRLEALFLGLDVSATDYRERIATLRHLMDEACDKRTITLSQWRTLLERVSHHQANCLSLVAARRIN